MGGETFWYGGIIIRDNLILFPLVGGVIGWVTNYLAVKMLFHPRRPVKIFFFTVQGLLPRRRVEVAENIARTIEQDLLSVDDLSEALNKVGFEEEIRTRINDKIDEKLDYELLNKIPLWKGLRLNVILPIKDIAVNEIIKYIKSYQTEFISGFKSKIDLRAIIYEKINNLDMERLESLVLKVAQKELRTIEVIGAVLGFVIGLFQVLLLI